MKYFFRLLRWPLGRLIAIIDRVTRPPTVEMLPGRRAQLDGITSSMALYQFQLCPFCVRTRRAIHRLGLNIETRDAKNEPRWAEELIREGGRYQVPCLRIVDDNGKVEWMYESASIISYLERRFG